MKKAGSLIISLVVVFALAFLTTNYLLPLFENLFNKRTYSQTNCLTEMITEDMDIYDIAKSYRDGQATVAVKLSVKNVIENEYYAPLGSGVCVASKGYKTSIDNNLVASMGSYIATNYHNIEYFYNSDYADCSVSIMTEKEETYPCEIVWYNEDLDLALLYCDGVNINYVTMKDRSLFCEDNEKLDYEQVFAIGTPLDTEYINRLTIGNVASNNPMLFYTGQIIYPKTNFLGTPTGYTNTPTGSATGYEVLSNTYEDTIDVAVGITNGNSGGGCFDSNGYLVGLTTLGGNVDKTHGNQMNGVVPIYPIIEVLDKVIANNETQSNHSIYSLQNLNIIGFDAYEAGIVSAKYYEAVENDYDLQYHFYDGKFYSSSYASDFNFTKDGYYILSNGNSALGTMTRGSVITSAQIDGQSKVDIVDRNDLIYLLLQIDNGDSVTFYYDNTSVKATF